MNRKWYAATLVMLCMALLTTAAWADGPIGRYYLTAGDQAMNWAVQGPNVVASGQQVGDEYAVALDGNFVRTLGNGNEDDLPGYEYTTGLVPTGNTYPYPVAGVAFYDGAQGNGHFYSVDYFAGGVYSFDTNWANPQLLFSVGVGGDLGITYDPFNNSLWISAFNGTSVSDYALDGSLLSSFNATFGSISSLAMDLDGTLWMGSQGTEGTFYHYDTNGNFLGSVFYADLADQNTLGGEIAIGVQTPEPSTLVLLGAGLAGALTRFRRKK
jgi:hypothetical protein